MTKRLFLYLSLVMVLIFTACGNKEQKIKNCKTLDDVLTAIDTETENIVKLSNERYATLKEQISSYEKYKISPNETDEFFNLIESDTDAYFDICDKYCDAYCKIVFEKYDNKEEQLQAIEDFYERVYTGSYEKYHDEVYGELYNKFNQEICKDLFREAKDTIPEDELRKAHSDCQEKYNDARSTLYLKFLNRKQRTFFMHSSMSTTARFDSEKNYKTIINEVNELCNDEDISE